MKLWKDEHKEFLEKLARKYQLREYIEETIDGITLNNDSDFRIDYTWCMKYYSLFNKKYFNNKLPILKKTNFHFVFNNFYRGECEGDFSLGISNGVPAFKYNFNRIKLSKYRYYTEKEYCETLLHEMIHLFVFSSPLISGEDLLVEHSTNFLTKKAEIDTYGWEIPIETGFTQTISSTAKNKIYKSILVVIEEAPDLYKLFLGNPKDKEAIKKEYSDSVMIFSLIHNKKVQLLPYCDNFLDEKAGRITMVSANKEDLDRFLKTISATQLNESIIKKEMPDIVKDVLQKMQNNNFVIYKVSPDTEAEEETWKISFGVH